MEFYFKSAEFYEVHKEPLLMGMDETTFIGLPQCTCSTESLVEAGFKNGDAVVVGYLDDCENGSGIGFVIKFNDITDKKNFGYMLEDSNNEEFRKYIEFCFKTRITFDWGI